MSNPYFDGMIKAAAIFLPKETLKTLSSASGPARHQAFGHLGDMSEASDQALHHLEEGHKAQLRVEAAEAHINTHGYSHQAARDLDDAITQRNIHHMRLGQQNGFVQNRGRLFNRALNPDSLPPKDVPYKNAMPKEFI